MVRLRLSPITAAIDGMSLVFDRIAQVFLILLTLVMVVEVVCRYVFNAPTLWAFDVSYMLNGAIFALGAAYTLRKNGHIRIDAVSQCFPQRWRDLIEVAFFLVLFVPCLGAITYYGLDKALEAYMTDELEQMSAWAPKVWPFLAALSIGLLALCVQSTLHALRVLVRLAAGTAMDGHPEDGGRDAV